MIALTTHDDVTRLELSSRRSRLVGYSVSAYLVRGVLVDTGFPALARELERFLAERRPRGVLVTHEHEDHAGNVAVALGLGSRVVVEDQATKARETYNLVFGDSVDFEDGHVSMASPIGRALVGKGVGDLAMLKLPASLRRLKIVELATIHSQAVAQG